MLWFHQSLGSSENVVNTREQPTVGILGGAPPSPESLEPYLTAASGPIVVAEVSSTARGTLSSGSLPQGYFALPARGINWGVLHHYNAVDIAAPCGTVVRAAADGLVVPDPGYGDGTTGWNGGYGLFVLVKHPLGTDLKTRYAHLEKVLVGIGDYVKQGDIVGLMGETGDATGCHVHFEVYGAKNPFAKN